MGVGLELEGRGWGPVIILMKEMRQSWPVFLRMKVLIGFSGAGGSVLDIFFSKVLFTNCTVAL